METMQNTLLVVDDSIFMESGGWHIKQTLSEVVRLLCSARRQAI
jgi:hypothetical protein